MNSKKIIFNLIISNKILIITLIPGIIVLSIISILLKFYLFMAIPFLLLMLISLHKIEYGIYTLAFIIPFSPSFKFIELGGRTIGITFEYAIVGLIIFIWVIKKLNIGKLTIKYNILLIPLIIFILIGFGSLFRAAVDVGVKRIIGGTAAFIGLIEFILLFSIIIDSLKNIDQVKKVIYIMLSAGILVSIISIIQYMSFKGEVYRLEPIFEGFIRGEDVKSNPNTYATYLMIIVFAGIIFGQINTKSKKIFFYISSCLSLIIIFLTGSRSSFLAVLSGLFIYGFIKNKKIIVLLLIAIIIIFSISEKYSNRFGSIIEIIKSRDMHKKFFELKYESVDWQQAKTMGLKGLGTDMYTGALRLTLWKEAIRLISARPFLGYGYQMNRYYSYSPTAENYFLDIWIMFGFFGFALMIYVFWILWKIAWSLRKNENLFIMTFSIFYLCFLFGIIIISLTGSVMFSPKIASYFWILSGLLIVLNNKKEVINRE